MEILDYQTPATPNGNHIVGAWYAVLSCTLSVVSLGLLNGVIFFLAWDEKTYSWWQAYCFACIPAGIILLLAFGFTVLLLRRRPRIRPVTILSLVFNLAALALFPSFMPA